jgi:hypothetical protein
MFENNIFENWLDKQSQECIEKIGKGQALKSEEMIILVLKAQSNHFTHLDTDLRKEMLNLRLDMNKKFDKVYNIMMWGFGLVFAGIILPLILNLLQK